MCCAAPDTPDISVDQSVPPTPKSVTFEVNDYGAVPDEDIDSGPGIRLAFDAAQKSNQSATVVFSAGVYRLGAEDRPGVWGTRTALYLENAKNIKLKGEPSTRLVITDPEAAALVINKCENIQVSDMAIDYDPLPFAQGTIVSVDVEGQSFLVRLDGGHEFIDFNNPAFVHAKSVRGFTVRTDEHGESIYGPIVIGARPAEEVSAGVWRLDVNPDLRWGKEQNKYTGYADALSRAKLVPGDRYIHWARAYTAAVSMISSEGVLCRNVEIGASPGLAFFPHLSGAITLDGCKVAIPTGSTRLISTNADGVHARGMRGPLVVKNCSFSALGDDAMNIHSSAIRPSAIVGPREVVFQNHTFTIRAGDALEQYMPDTGSAQGPFEVEAVSRVANDRNDWRVVFGSDSVPQMTTEEDRQALMGTIFYNLSEAGSGFEIRDNYFGPHRGRGILLSAIHGVIEGNTFKNREVGSGWAIVMHHETSIWAEGPVARDIVIRNNCFIGPGGHEPAIEVYRIPLPGIRQPLMPSCESLLIEGNEFQDIDGPAAVLYDVANLTLKKNAVVQSGATAPTAIEGGASSTRFPAAFVLHSCPDADVGQNTNSDPRFNTSVKEDAF